MTLCALKQRRPGKECTGLITTVLARPEMWSQESYGDHWSAQNSWTGSMRCKYGIMGLLAELEEAECHPGPWESERAERSKNSEECPWMRSDFLQSEIPVGRWQC